MLEPHERRLLSESLLPPPNYLLHSAIMTTFSLDLIAILGIPLSFSIFKIKEQDSVPGVHPLALLEALRQYSDRILLFCQAGQIVDSGQVRYASRLLGFMEKSIIEANSPRGGAFHPKISVLRFAPKENNRINDDGKEERPVVYRFLCGTRNLTFDSSWDTLLTIEGELRDQRQNSVARNHKLADFIASLPAMALRSLDKEKKALIQMIVDELRKVVFRTPEGFNDFEFWPIGYEEKGDYWPFNGYTRTLAISPFVSDGFISRLEKNVEYLGLVSSFETLESLKVESVGKLKDAYYLHAGAEVAEDMDTEESAMEKSDESKGGLSPRADQEEQIPLGKGIHGKGLHAKLYITEDGSWDSHVWTGSANATDAAYKYNVEFLTKLIGRRSQIGIGKILGGDEDPDLKDKRTGPVSFRDLLLRYQRIGALADDDAYKSKADDIFRRIRRELAMSLMTANVEIDKESYSISVHHSSSHRIAWPENVKILCRPISLGDSYWKSLESPLVKDFVGFHGISFEALTSFFVYEVKIKMNNREWRERFILNIPLTGLPVDRLERILLNSLQSPEYLIRYILMLFADEDADLSGFFSKVGKIGKEEPDEKSIRMTYGNALLEPMLKILEREPQKLQYLEDLIEDLQKARNGKDLLSDEFLEIWQVVNNVRKGRT